MTRLPVICLCALLAPLISAGAAHAHQLFVAPPGAVALDLAGADAPRLVHVTLVQASDQLEATLITNPGTTQTATLLVPDDRPEAEAARRELPRAERRVGASTQAFSAVNRTRGWTDPTTDVAYRAVGELVLDGSTVAGDGPVTSVLRVSRGAAPTRAALLVVEGRAPFAADDVKTTPRTVLALRAWAEAPAPGSRSVRRDASPEGLGRLVWLPVGMGALALAVAVWWLTSGLRKARERGAERNA